MHATQINTFTFILWTKLDLWIFNVFSIDFCAPVSDLPTLTTNHRSSWQWLSITGRHLLIALSLDIETHASIRNFYWPFLCVSNLFQHRVCSYQCPSDKNGEKGGKVWSYKLLSFFQSSTGHFVLVSLVCGAVINFACPCLSWPASRIRTLSCVGLIAHPSSVLGLSVFSSLSFSRSSSFPYAQRSFHSWFQTKLPTLLIRFSPVHAYFDFWPVVCSGHGRFSSELASLRLELFINFIDCT